MDIAALKVLIYRMILFQLANSTMIDEATAEDLEHYVLKNYFPEEQTTTRDDDVDMEVLTGILLFLLSNCSKFGGIVSFLLLNKKFHLGNAAFDEMNDAVQKSMGIVLNEQEEVEEQQPKDEENSDDEDKGSDTEEKQETKQEKQEQADEDMASDDSEQDDDLQQVSQEEMMQIMNEHEPTDEDMLRMDNLLGQLVRQRVKCKFSQLANN